MNKKAFIVVCIVNRSHVLMIHTLSPDLVGFFCFVGSRFIGCLLAHLQSSGTKL